MKLPTKNLIVLILFIGIGQVYAQTESEKNTSLNLQFGLSTPFGLPANSSSIIPQFGLDFDFGKFGFRATQQFFKTSPEFDINEYLEPFGSDITQTGVKEKSSNFVMGIIPYLNLQLKDNLLLQPALGLKYLIQNGATNYVTYTPDPRISLLEYPDGDARRSSFVIEPSIRAVFGKASKPVRFYVEAGYAFAVGNNEVTYSYLDLSNILTPDGSIDPDLLGSAPKITGIEKIMSNAFILGIGLELNITSSPTSVNHNSARSNRNYPKANIEKDPGGGDDIPDEQINSTEIKPLLVVSKGATKNKQGDAVTFSWEALNTGDCKPDMIELFEIIEKPTSIKDDKGVVYNNTGAEKQLLKKYLKPKEGNIHTYKITKEQMPELFDPDKEFIWQVTLLDKDGNKPQCAWGGKNVVKNNYKSSNDCMIDLIIDSVKCSGGDINDNFYEVWFSIINTSGVNCTNPQATLGASTFTIYEVGSYIPQTWLQSPGPFNGQTVSIGNTFGSVCANLKIPKSNTKFGICVNPMVGIPDYGGACEEIDLPPCGCDFCDSVFISVISKSSLPIVTSHSGYDEISFPVEITYSPWNVSRIVAEIIAFQHEVNDPNCKTCFTENAGHGVFLNPTKNVITGNIWQNGGNAVFHPSSSSYSREATWFNTLQGGIDLSAPLGRPTSIDLNIGVPELNSLNCCQDKIRFSIRYSFITIEDKVVCKVCEIVKTYCYVRDGNGKNNKLTCKSVRTIKTVD